MALIVRFVGTVGDDGSGAGLRYDLSPLAAAAEGTRFQVGDGYAFPPPELIRATTEGGRPVAADYADIRQVTLPVLLGAAASASTRSAQLAALLRELRRDRNVLYVRQEGATLGRWLTTYPVSPEAAAALSLAGGGAAVPLVIDADAFAYGALVTDGFIEWRRFSGATAFGFGQVSSDQPASEGAASQWYKQTLTAALGDVPAPVNLVIAPAAGQVLQSSVLIASRPVRHETYDTLRFHRQESGVANAGASGGTHYRHTPTGTGVEETADDPTVRGLPLVVAGATTSVRQLLGQWRLLYRLRQSVSSDVWRVRAVEGSIAGPSITAVPITLSTGTVDYYWADLGVMQVPAGDLRLTRSDPFGEPYAATEFLPMLRATRLSGTGTLSVDYALAVPADGDTLIIANQPVGATGAWGIPDTDRLVVDGDRGMVYNVWNWATAAQQPKGQQPIPSAGGIPTLSPDYPTQLFVVLDFGPGATSIALSATVGVSYRPRYLSVI